MTDRPPDWQRRTFLRVTGVAALASLADDSAAEGGSREAQPATGYGDDQYSDGRYGGPTPPSTPIGDAGTPPADRDADGLYEDIDGDGDIDRRDVLRYYRNRDADAIRDNPTFFDFDGDGSAGSVSDALVLHERYVE